jgi:branched-subunit amino acid aminotransferase/4-amino-4-deoxychorismate lyase
MLCEADRHYHMQRATMELDLAYRAERFAAMEAHLRLSALHMARLKRSAPEPRPA